MLENLNIDGIVAFEKYMHFNDYIIGITIKSD